MFVDDESDDSYEATWKRTGSRKRERSTETEKNFGDKSSSYESSDVGKGKGEEAAKSTYRDSTSKTPASPTSHSSQSTSKSSEKLAPRQADTSTPCGKKPAQPSQREIEEEQILWTRSPQYLMEQTRLWRARFPTGTATEKSAAWEPRASAKSSGGKVGESSGAKKK